LIEVFERRHLFAHTDGIVSDKYLNVLTQHNLLKEDLKKGHRLTAPPEYFKKSIHNVIEFSAKLIQVVWRKSENEVELADELLGTFCFELIEREQYQLAADLLLFSESLKGTKAEQQRLVNKVNLANCYNLMDNTQKALEILDSEDWTARSDYFNICVAAVKRDLDTVLDFMLRLQNNPDWKIENFQEWPVFNKIRDEERFKKQFLEVYGLEYVSTPTNPIRIQLNPPSSQ